MLRAARARAGALWEEAELAELSAELRAGVKELRDVRREVGGGLRGEAPAPTAGRARPPPPAQPAPPPGASGAGRGGRAGSPVHPRERGGGGGPEDFLPFSARDVGMGPGRSEKGRKGSDSGADVFAEAVAEHVLARRANAWLAAHPPGSARERAALEKMAPLASDGANDNGNRE